MFVLRKEKEDACFEFVEIVSRLEFPFEEFTVVSGRLAGVEGASSQQFTCVSGRVGRHDCERKHALLLVFAADQVLATGATALAFAQQMRATFPNLVKKKINCAATFDSDDDDDDDTASKDTASSQPPTLCPMLANVQIQQFASASELTKAFAISHAKDFLDTLHQRHGDNPVQFVTMLFPPVGQPSKEANCSCHDTEGHIKYHFAVILQHKATSNDFLDLPLVQHPLQSDVFQDATLITLGSLREASEHGGGKTSEEMVQNIKMRHASGTFCTLMEPTATWQSLTQRLASELPFLQTIEPPEHIRLRKVMGGTFGHEVHVLLEMPRHQSRK